VAIGFDLRITRLGVPFNRARGPLLLPVERRPDGLLDRHHHKHGQLHRRLDGLAAGVCAISALTFSIIAVSIDRSSGAVIAAVLAGATFAFLRFNFIRQHLMGDAGSMLLGYVLAVLSVQSLVKSAATVTLVLPMLVLGIPFIDLFLVVVFRRLASRCAVLFSWTGSRAP